MTLSIGPLNSSPSYFTGELHPVECVSWYDATEFCNRLSRYTGRHYRLPSEAEWEYACRAHTTTPFYCGETITAEQANFNRTIDQTTPVNRYPCNGFGLHDMQGNLYEWCQDVWHFTYDGAPNDGRAWITEGDERYRVTRGSSWFSIPRFCRSAHRSYSRPQNANYYIGFRVVCESSSPVHQNG